MDYYHDSYGNARRYDEVYKPAYKGQMSFGKDSYGNPVYEHK